MSNTIDQFDHSSFYENEYFVEKILDKKKYKDVWKYKVKWVGYTNDDCTWEPIENLQSCLDLVEKYEQEKAIKTMKSPKSPIKSPVNQGKKKKISKLISLEDEEEKSCEEFSTNKKCRLIDDGECQVKSEEINKSSPTKDQKQKGEEELISSQISKSTDDEDKIQPATKESPTIQGNFEEDKAELILKSTIIDNISLELNCLVQWKIRENGITPESTWISSKEIYEKDAKLLVRYYETKIKLPKP